MYVIQNNMIVDILQSILNCTEFVYQLRLCQINSMVNENIFIYELPDIQENFENVFGQCGVVKKKLCKTNRDMLYYVDSNVITQKKFSKLQKIFVRKENNIINMNHLKNTLTKLTYKNDSAMEPTLFSDLQILQYLKFERFIGTSTLFEHNFNPALTITDLDCQYVGYKSSFDQDCINCFKVLKKLNCSNNNDIRDLNHLRETLEDVTCSGAQNLVQIGISSLKLKRFVCRGVNNITNLNHMSDTLAELDISCNENISQEGISKLSKLEILDCSYNRMVNSVNHLSDTLKKLVCRRSGITQEGIAKLENITYLDCKENEFINNLNHMKNTLQTLYCGSTGIYDNGICELGKLKKMVIDGNTYIANIDFLGESLEELHCCTNLCSLGQNSINKLKKIKILNCRDNNKIKNVNHLSNTLTALDCSGECGIKQNGISQLNKIELFVCNDNMYIRDIHHLDCTLRELHCCGKSAVSQKNIQKLTKLRKLYFAQNKKIIDVNHLSDTLKQLDIHNMLSHEGWGEGWFGVSNNNMMAINHNGIYDLHDMVSIYLNREDDAKNTYFQFAH